MEIGSNFLFLFLSCQMKYRLMLVFGICAHTMRRCAGNCALTRIQAKRTTIISPQRYTLYIMQIQLGTAFIDVKFNDFDT
jgi:hypothetical protein